MWNALTQFSYSNFLTYSNVNSIAYHVLKYNLKSVLKIIFHKRDMQRYTFRWITCNVPTSKSNLKFVVMFPDFSFCLKTNLLMNYLSLFLKVSNQINLKVCRQTSVLVSGVPMGGWRNPIQKKVLLWNLYIDTHV